MGDNLVPIGLSEGDVVASLFECAARLLVGAFWRAAIWHAPLWLGTRFRRQPRAPRGAPLRALGGL